jgi:hypothetical protein
MLIEGALFLQHLIAGAGQFMRQRFGGLAIADWV